MTFTTPQHIHTADGSAISAIGRGDVKINLPLGDKRTTVTLKAYEGHDLGRVCWSIA
jgi:hypothetical protein